MSNRCYLLQMPSPSKSNSDVALRAYWCARARRFVEPGDIAYDFREYERLTQGPLERGAWGEDSGCFPIG